MIGKIKADIIIKFCEKFAKSDGIELNIILPHK
jgi:hypothetical protein